MTVGEVASVIGALGSVISSIAALWAVARLAVVHKMVNGQSEKLNIAIRDGAFLEGKATGQAEERAYPMVPAEKPDAVDSTRV